MKERLPILFLLAYFLTSCFSQPEHFIPDNQYRQFVETDFESRVNTTGIPSYFPTKSIKGLSRYETEALHFLYAYMPLCDIIDHDTAYFIRQIRLTRQALHEMPWGKSLDNSLIRHFVLPIRVNNEPLDEARAFCYQELKSRIQGLSMMEAAIEVNHWCHEKVSYTPSDGRTSSPLQSIRTAYGRCGEESTLCVAAMRSVGIPARQVYVPRWAHTDDNHAWVEVWVDGRWHFLGACEPEPVLDLGWFNAPASRSLLMHTKVFGHYAGEEEILNQEQNYTEINVINNYAPCDQITVSVNDEEGRPVSGATVEFKIYNYAEFYTAVTKRTSPEGTTSLTAGLGDMMIWASHEGAFGYQKVRIGQDSQIAITLQRGQGTVKEECFDITPPQEHYHLPTVTEAQRSDNEERIFKEDSIRSAYISTMMEADSALAWLKSEGVTKEEFARFLAASRGNHPSIKRFIQKSKDKESALSLLKTLSAKDLRDAQEEILSDHLTHSPHLAGISEEEYRLHVLAPRIELEAMTPYKSFFRQALPEDLKSQTLSNPFALIDWCEQNIRINNKGNLAGIVISPRGVFESHTSDSRSLGVFFVAVCRSLGIPSWIDEITGKICYLHENKVCEAKLKRNSAPASQQGTLRAFYQTSGGIENPKYYTHFTISKLENGMCKLLTYDEGDADMGGGASYKNLLSQGTRLDEGYYMLVSGTRQLNGKVLCNVTFFNILPNEETVVPLVLRQPKTTSNILGQFEKQLLPFESSNKLQIIGILGAGEEPTNHVLRDIALYGKQIDQWGGQITMLFPSLKAKERFNLSEFPGLPQNIHWDVDKQHLQQAIAQSMMFHNPTTLPIIVICDKNANIYYCEQGYTIGIGEQLYKTVHQHHTK